MITVAMVVFGVLASLAVDRIPDPIPAIAVSAHLLIVCGLPTAVVLARRRVDAALLAVLLSIGITAIAAQPLVWLRSFSTPVLVIEATILGAATAVLARLLRRPA